MKINPSTIILYQVKVNVLITNKQQRVLLIKEKVRKQNRPLWNTIKGSYDNCKENILQTAIRECKEEASVKVQLTHILGVYCTRNRLKVTIQFGFLAQIESGIPKIPNKDLQKILGEDISEIKWFNKATIVTMKPSEFVSLKTYQLIQDWLSKKKYPLELYKDLSKNL